MKIKKEEFVKSSKERRQVLIDNMDSLEKRGAHCGSCSAKCCTSFANSMQVTPIEGLDILNYLMTQNLWDEELKEKLKKCIKIYRLDFFVSGNQTMRRTYDCPFLNDAPLGCGLPKEIKPYGCLGFNANGTGVQDGENCSSDFKALEARDLTFREEEKMNSKLQTQLNLSFNKLPLPMALLEIEASREFQNL